MAGMADPAAGSFPTLRLEHFSTVDRAAEELRRAVLEGDLASGTPLREMALAESLGVSRPTVREALAVLVAEGLAIREPHRGVSVSTPEADSVRDVCRAREVLEGAGVRRWPDAPEAARAQVRTRLEGYTAAVTAGAAYPELNQRHLAFHVSLVGLLDSPRLVGMAESLVLELRLALARVDRIRRNAHAQAGSHAALVRMLDDGDVEGASQFLRVHLADAEGAIVSALELV